MVWTLAMERNLLPPERPDDPVALAARRRFLESLSRVRDVAITSHPRRRGGTPRPGVSA